MRLKLCLISFVRIIEGGQVTQSGTYEELLSFGMAFEQLNAHNDAYMRLQITRANKRWVQVN